jgi:hypothetical protein
MGGARDNRRPLGVSAYAGEQQRPAAVETGMLKKLTRRGKYPQTHNVVSILHNIVHLLFGIAGLAMARTAAQAPHLPGVWWRDHWIRPAGLRADVYARLTGALRDLACRGGRRRVDARSRSQPGR